MFPVPDQYYMSYPPTSHIVPPHSHQYGNVATNGNGNGNLNQQQQQQQHSQTIAQLTQHVPASIETVHLYVPNSVIGAIIGTKGLFIKSIIKNSNASVKVNEFCLI